MLNAGLHNMQIEICISSFGCVEIVILFEGKNPSNRNTY